MKLFSGTISTIEHALDYSSLKQKVISHNIANADTPNYKAKDASFKEAFQQAVNGSLEANKSDARHYDFNGSASSAQGLVTKRNVSYNHNGNSVDLDKEMSDLATNQIYYNAMIERMSGKFSSLQNVIRGGK
ncbi:flagellar basal body rod protein FlgB [Bacillus sp. ISL-47]|uniref:flagellar basal body rod protein FlgB n=1 Tax=Bacillus sp. ISL-47 TaxID=2819130 RepID=UPI001BECAE7D|nr:flagellar basal body rod protein FlgB [Bacillus sp. ISL-47]MBT2688551.1 flagellar basal body rod protein FlgB [Bacillus sp. ISL-47]MBT2708849.1 flagellar basal body rod protein FlgB [Pseudomonas sp. ISL-84]